MRDAGVMDQEVWGQIVDGQRQSVVNGPSGQQMERGKTPINGRVVILDASRDAEQSSLEIANEGDQILAVDRRPGDLGQSLDERDGQCRGPAEAGATRSIRPCRAADPREMQ